MAEQSPGGDGRRGAVVLPRGRLPARVDWTPLRARAVRLLLGSATCSALGLYAPAMHMALDAREEGILDSGVLHLQACISLFPNF